VSNPAPHHHEKALPATTKQDLTKNMGTPPEYAAPVRSDVCEATSREGLTTGRSLEEPLPLMPQEWSNHDRTRAPHRLRRSSRA
jgi:hypothetical protein